jgi:hypothetical protein
MTQLRLEFDSISPVTGELSVIEEVDENTGKTAYICMQSGWATNESLLIDSELVTTYESSMPQLIIDSKVIDHQRGLVWYPTSIQTPVAILYPYGETVSDLVWVVAEIIELTDAEKQKYPLLNQDNTYYDSMLDIDNAKTYSKLEFEQALDQLYYLLASKSNED